MLKSWLSKCKKHWICMTENYVPCILSFISLKYNPSLVHRWIDRWRGRGKLILLQFGSWLNSSYSRFGKAKKIGLGNSMEKIYIFMHLKFTIQFNVVFGVCTCSACKYLKFEKRKILLGQHTIHEFKLTFFIGK